jgi:flagellar biosynthesis protein FlhA
VCKVLQNLLREGIPVRDIRSISETLVARAPESQETDTLTDHVRVALKKTIVQEVFGLSGEIPVLTLDAKLEQMLLQSLKENGSDGCVMEPGLAERMHLALANLVGTQTQAGEVSALLTAPVLRKWMARLFSASIPGLHVLAYNEIPDNRQIRVIGSIGGDGSVNALSHAA